MVKSIINKHFNRSSSPFKNILNTLWATLKGEEVFVSQKGPYPADHGEKHITNTLIKLNDLLSPYERTLSGKEPPFKTLFTIERKAELFASVMIHDIGMINLLPEGSDSKQSEEARKKHSNPRIITMYAEKILYQTKFNTNAVDRIIQIAAAHSGDDLNSAHEKLKNINNLSKRKGNNHLCEAVALVRLADFLDIGKERLNTYAEKLNWSDRQFAHLQKHLLLSVSIDVDNNKIEFELKDKKSNISQNISAIEQLSILREVHEDAAEAIDHLNNVMRFTGVTWTLDPLDEAKYGQIWPLSSGASLFRRQFQKARFNQKEKDIIEPFPVDWMGHSLYQRFVEDSEGLNNDLKELLSSGNMAMRVLLLDPSVENQQMCEVYEAQQDSKQPSDNKRSILPRYNGKDLDQKSDIHESLDDIARWAKEVKWGASLEVRVTTRLMYMSLARFDKRIIITPYRGGGLFNESFAIVLTEESPLYKVCADEFDSIWKSALETRLAIHAYGDTTNLSKSKNPISCLLYGTNFGSKIRPFDYERFVLGEYSDRIRALFEAIDDETKIFPPPFEVEIQPSEKCELNCHYCIGRHLRHRGTSTNTFNYDLNGLLTYQQNDWKIDRFRISGLFGDPLEKSSQDIALDFLGKAKKADRKVVLFTNGFALSEKKVRDALTAAKDINISLDAATKETYANIKRVDESYFDIITNNLSELCHELKRDKDKAVSVGVGFVVTKWNEREIEDAIKLAKNLGASFIRFKPDLRGMNAISWRAWREFSQSIQTIRKKYAGISINLTNIVWYRYNVPVTERCWAQYLCTTIGADGNVYPCDHLTGNGMEGSLGNIGKKPFQEIWEAAPRKRHDARYRECIICPPFGLSINKLLDELHVLYKKYGWDQVNIWIDEALRNNPNPAPD